MGTLDNPLSHNLYAYCANNPLIYVDPSGHSYNKWQHQTDMNYKVIGYGFYTSASGMGGEGGLLTIKYMEEYMSTEALDEFDFDKPFVYAVGGLSVGTSSADNLLESIADESLIKGNYKIKLSGDVTLVEIRMRNGSGTFHPETLEDLGDTIGATIGLYKGSISETPGGIVQMQDYGVSLPWMSFSKTSSITKLLPKTYTDKIFESGNNKYDYYNDYSWHGKN